MMKKDRTRIPEPARPFRKEELPWQTPKPALEDPQCREKLEHIINSPSYIPAKQDEDFLESEDTRGVRLQLDYLKPETLLKKHGIEHTIVVYGSTRIVEPIAAQKKLDTLQHKLAEQPGDKILHHQVAVAKRILQKSRYYDVAVEFTKLVAGSANGHPLVVMTGGGPGIMEAANRGAHKAGAKTVGLNITLPHEQFPNPYVTPELCFQFHYFSMRKMHFLLRARALIAFPGGYGTFDELFETLTLIQTRKIKPIPVILVGESFWRKAFDVDFLVDEGVIASEDRDLFWFAETATEIWEGLLEWYQRNGEDLLPGG